MQQCSIKFIIEKQKKNKLKYLTTNKSLPLYTKPKEKEKRKQNKNNAYRNLIIN